MCPVSVLLISDQWRAASTGCTREGTATRRPPISVPLYTVLGGSFWSMPKGSGRWVSPGSESGTQLTCSQSPLVCGRYYVFFCKSDPVSCDSVLAILEKYEAASGQRINLQKSAITFSAKTPVAIRIKVKERLHIEAEGGIGKYLGLPEHFSRRKRDFFANIVDRICQRSHSWTSKYLNGAGKQVLLKAVLTAMPAYAMSCFKLPLSLCKQIQSFLTRFWWDVKPELRKMSWVS